MLCTKKPGVGTVAGVEVVENETTVVIVIMYED